METFLSDVRIGSRSLARRPVFTATVLLVLALGIGANTAIFSVVNAVLLSPLSFRDPDRLVAVWETVPEKGLSRWRVAPGTFLDWREQCRSFSGMAVFGASTLTLTGAGEPVRLSGSRVSADYFGVLGVEPALGRAFLEGEDRPEADRVVVLGHGLWGGRFGADPGIVGRTIALDGEPYTVVGVMPAGIYPARPLTSSKIVFPSSEQQFWVPLRFTPQLRNNRTMHVFGVLGRLNPGVTRADAQAEMETVMERLAAVWPANAGEGALVSPLRTEVVGDVEHALLVLLGTVAFVWLVASANIANLLLARFASREREVAVRSALGAGRWRIVRQFFVEGLLLALLGGVAASWLAMVSVPLLVWAVPQEIPRLDRVDVDASVLAFAAVLSLLTSVAFGLIPALQASRLDLVGALKEGGGGATPGRHRLRRLLVVAQVGLATILVVGAALLVRSFWLLQRVEPGFDPEGVLVAKLVLPQSRYGEWPRISGFYASLLERLAALPGVESAAVSYDHPLEATWVNGFAVEGRLDGPQPSGRFCPVSPDYFRTAGIELIRGRGISDSDTASRPGVVVVNETLARRYFPDRDPIGNRLRIDPPSRMWGEAMPEWYEVVGVVRDVRSLGLGADVEPGFYVPALQAPLQDMTVLIRTQGDPLALAAALGREVRALDPDQAVAEIATMEGIVADSVAQPRFTMVVMAGFGALAVLLASVGVYGLLAFSVERRTREIGVRMALGARRGDVLALVVGEGAALAVAGIGIGVAASLALSRVLSGLLFGVSATDPATFVAVPVVLAGVVAIASLVPALRALRVDPAEALRTE